MLFRKIRKSFMKKTILLLLLPLVTLIGCNNNSEPQYETYTVDFSSDAIQTTDSTSSNFANVMKNNINLKNEIVSTVEGQGFCQINVNCKDHDDKTFKSLIMSSKKQDGTLIFNFVKKIHSLTIYASPYASWIQYTKQWSVDEESVLKVNEETWNITPFDTELTEVPVYQREFTIENTSATIDGTAGSRTIIRKIDFAFVK